MGKMKELYVEGDSYMDENTQEFYLWDLGRILGHLEEDSTLKRNQIMDLYSKMSTLYWSLEDD